MEAAKSGRGHSKIMPKGLLKLMEVLDDNDDVQASHQTSISLMMC